MGVFKKIPLYGGISVTDLATGLEVDVHLLSKLKNAMGLNIPSGVTVRPTHGNETGQTRLQLPPCALHVICMVRMWQMKH